MPALLHTSHTSKLPAYQDGAQFYDARTGKVIATYPHKVGDYDLPAAISARAWFLTEFPHCYIEV